MLDFTSLASEEKMNTRTTFSFKFLLFVVLAIASVSVLGQDANTAPQATPDPAKAEQIKEAKRLLEQFVDPKAPATADNPKGKTMGDVLDKGIDMFAGYVTSVSDMLQKIAPDVWRIMIRQQYAKAVTTPLVPFLLLLMVLIYHKLARGWFKVDGETQLIDFSDDYETGRTWFLTILPAFVAIVIGIWMILGLSDAIRIVINPEYYALKDLIGMILGKQTL